MSKLYPDNVCISCPRCWKIMSSNVQEMITRSFTWTHTYAQTNMFIYICVWDSYITGTQTQRLASKNTIWSAFSMALLMIGAIFANSFLSLTSDPVVPQLPARDWRRGSSVGTQVAAAAPSKNYHQLSHDVDGKLPNFLSSLSSVFLLMANN